MSSSHKATYGALSRFNHWAIAVVMIGMLGFGLYLDNAELAREARGSLIGLHKAIGVLFLVFALWRVGYRLVCGFPVSVADMPAWQETVAKGVHWLLLAGILIMPISGVLMSLYGGHAIDVFGLFAIPVQEKNETLAEIGHILHGLGGKVLLIAIAVHVVAALKHHIVDRDETLMRMAGWVSERKGTAVQRQFKT